MTSKKFLWKASLHLLVFLIPTQLAFHFWPDFAFVFGLRIDYLAPTIYLTDILAFLIIVPNLKPILNWLISNKKAVLIIILYSGLNIYFSDIWMISLLKWLKLLELYLLGLSVYLNRDFVSTQSLYKTIYISAVLFGLISIVQIILNRTTGFLWVFGERSFSAATPGIALASFFGTSLLRGYSTFPHPNAFAGFIGVTLLMLVNQISKNKLYFVLTAFLLIPFVLTFSLSSYVALLVCLPLLLIRKNVDLVKFTVLTVLLGSFTSLVLTFLSEELYPSSISLGQSIFERVELMFYSSQIIISNFWLGAGFNTFVSNVPKYVGVLGNGWILQPVHNIFLLIFSELGAIGVLMYFYALIKTSQFVNKSFKLIILFVIVSGFFDHYWLTIQQNTLLLTLLISLNINKARN